MTESLDWFIERCPECGAWNDLTSRVFETYGCVTCKMMEETEK